MALTESRIRRIIREEISSMIDEWDEWGDDDEPDTCAPTRAVRRIPRVLVTPRRIAPTVVVIPDTDIPGLETPRIPTRAATVAETFNLQESWPDGADRI
jgi:hypothetical protein